MLAIEQHAAAPLGARDVTDRTLQRVREVRHALGQRHAAQVVHPEEVIERRLAPLDTAGAVDQRIELAFGQLAAGEVEQPVGVDERLEVRKLLPGRQHDGGAAGVHGVLRQNVERDRHVACIGARSEDEDYPLVAADRRDVSGVERRGDAI